MSSNEDMLRIIEATKDKKYDIVGDKIKKIIGDMALSPMERVNMGLNTLANAIDAEACTFWFVGANGDGLIRPRAVYGGSEISDIKLKPGEGIAGQVIQSGQSVLIRDCQKDPRWTGKVDAKSGFMTRSMICVPFRYNGIVFGCIQVINKKTNELFDEKDLKLADYFSEQVSKELSKAPEPLLKKLDLIRTNWDEKQSLATVFGAPTAAEALAEFEKQPLFDQLSFLAKPLARMLIRNLWGIFHKVDKL